MFSARAFIGMVTLFTLGLTDQDLVALLLLLLLFSKFALGSEIARHSYNTCAISQ